MVEWLEETKKNLEEYLAELAKDYVLNTKDREKLITYTKRNIEQIKVLISSAPKGFSE